MSSSKISSLTNKHQDAFSTAASRYDENTFFHRDVAFQLMERIKAYTHLKNIIDIGCGTGHLTGELKRQFPIAQLSGLDLAEGMIMEAAHRAEGINWMLADAHKLPFKDQSMDLVVSNLAYQWIFDLPAAFGEIRRVLAPKGVFMATMFGFNTCKELFTSLESTSTKANFKRLSSCSDILQALKKAGFQNPQVGNQFIKIHFEDLKQVLSWMKAIGANRLSTDEFLGPKALSQANNYCLENFPYYKGVGMTFEVIWIAC